MCMYVCMLTVACLHVLRINIYLCTATCMMQIWCISGCFMESLILFGSPSMPLLQMPLLCCFLYIFPVGNTHCEM
uniref:Uncharacterized protein n=1 Tax=Myripristis murdjan TaxID=586833 RepID=A0A667XND5_9TELE